MIANHGFAPVLSNILYVYVGEIYWQSLCKSPPSFSCHELFFVMVWFSQVSFQLTISMNRPQPRFTASYLSYPSCRVFYVSNKFEMWFKKGATTFSFWCLWRWIFASWYKACTYILMFFKASYWQLLDSTAVRQKARWVFNCISSGVCVDAWVDMIGELITTVKIRTTNLTF